MSVDTRKANGQGPAGGGLWAGRTALYAFCREEERTCDDQLADLQKVELEQGGGVEWYTDWLGKAEFARSGYCELLQHLRGKKIDWLVVWRLDKLGLGTGGLAELFEELARYGAGFTSLEDGLCLEPAALAELPGVLNAAVFCERRLNGQKTAEGQALAKKAGQHWGGSEPGRRLHVTKEQEEAVLRYAAEGRPKAWIAHEVGVSRPTVYRLLGMGQRRRSRRKGGAA